LLFTPCRATNNSDRQEPVLAPSNLARQGLTFPTVLPG
jgi:hypothetical protein